MYLVYFESNDSAMGDRGLTGEKGDKGDKGLKGFRGMDGPIGKMGIKGDPNISSLPGEKGEIGERGEKGDRGDRGDRGPIGDRGIKGKRGEDGTPGIKGDLGDQGIKGKNGNDNIIEFLSSDEKSYEYKQNLRVKNGYKYNESFLPNPGQKVGLDLFNTRYKAGIQNREFGGINYNGIWDNFVTGYVFKGNTKFDDYPKGYTTNLKIKINNK